jgi:hypothetical protein
MHGTRTYAWFFAKFLFFFVIFLIPWPRYTQAYGGYFRSGCNLLFSSFGGGAETEFMPMSDPDGKRDTRVLLANRKTGMVAQTHVSSQLQGLQPTVYVLALILATPVPWSRKWRALLLGFVAISVYVAFRVAIFLLGAFNGDDSLAVFSFGPFVTTMIGFLKWVVVTSFAGNFVVPVPIWLLVTFRRGDWAVLFRSNVDSEDSGSRAGDAV